MHHLLLLLLLILGGCQASTPPTPTTADRPSLQPLPGHPPLAALVDSLRIDPRSIRFHVRKSSRTFSVLTKDSVLCTYPCVLGEVPEGDKMMQGDRRTPEGTFGIRSKRMHDKWHAFVWIDYPNDESRRRFNARKREGLVPANADIGGEIGIHGVPAGKDHWIDAGVDWTWGCIALKNPDMDEIYPFIAAGRTTITIEP